MLLRTRAGRRAASAASVLALTTTLAGTAGAALAAPPDRAAAGKPAVASLFPTDALTVADPGQLTGRRVDLPTAGCGAASPAGGTTRSVRSYQRSKPRRWAVAMLRLLVTEAPAFFSDFEVYAGDDRREAARVGYRKV